MTLTHKELVEVLKYIEASSFAEFSLHTEGTDLLLRRNTTGSAVTPRAVSRVRRPRQELAVEKVQAPRQTSVKQTTEVPSATAVESEEGKVVLAPMSGTFYRRPAPDSDPFVDRGSEVKKGDPLCMIEVMKLFSTVYAETAGRVTAIKFDDGDAVEQGQVLIVIGPVAK